ncbi:tetratricopeptide repeat protein [Thalassococcus lentus]|uniref:Tetratricopeptide repeat protein 38 n=1 Tax=Thalassococcus lentus TaxID=1210524 RepID=A0ABT4XSC1_9RHOB|nr:tetratricopeptide repeat protein [Thalassococcus lentus]MDA7424852.1 tetratricopeptide repeat protein [Thalassococcus lentus]
MTISDAYGNTLTTGTAMSRDFYDIGVKGLLAATYGAKDVFEQAISADPEFALGYVALARARMLGGDMPGARTAMAAAERLAPMTTEQEQSHINVMALLVAGKPVETRAAVWEHVQRWPRDAVIAQLCTNVFGLIGFSGKVGREADLLSYTTMLMPHYGEDWWMMSMHALSLCETGATSESLDLMERSLALNPHNANAAHFKAHALYEIGETRAGRAYLDDWLTGYDKRGGLHGHLTWHAALWALQDGDEERLWALVDAGVAPDTGSSMPINVVTDTAAIYHRAELAGLTVAPERWAALSDYTAERFPKPGQSFVDMHAALAHAMSGNGDRLAAVMDVQKGYAHDLARPAARAWGAIARGQWQDALENLIPVLAQSERIGGSRAQRDLLELTYANVLLKLGLTDEARRVLSLRRPNLAKPLPVSGLVA